MIGDRVSVADERIAGNIPAPARSPAAIARSPATIAGSPATIAGNLATGEGKNGSKCDKNAENTYFQPEMVKRRPKSPAP